MNVQVTNAGGSSEPFSASLQTYAPAFFRFDPDERKYVAAVHADGTLVGREGLFPGVVSRPVKPGDVILLSGTGFSETNPATADGLIVASPMALAQEITVRFGGVEAETSFAGVVSNGLVQINVTVLDLPEGDAAVSVEVSGVSSGEGACVNVSPSTD